jgi:signal transduction histidine kinase
LVTNAIKFTKPGGSIQISATQKNQNVEIVVADTGVGMDQKSQDKLFRTESNFTSYGTANEKGTGLGLIICKEFVERHGGKIRVESTSGVGSKFIFTLPVRA